MAKKVVAPIWSEDGKTLTNALVNDKLKTYNVVTEWYDGTPMDSTKVDDDLVYISYEGKFLRENFIKEQDTFLEKNTVQQTRSLSTKEILLLKMGVYKGIGLSGYYQEGDTPGRIEYFLSNTSEEDDGGSVFQVGGIKLEHKFVGEIDLSYFGIKVGLDVLDNHERVNKAITYSTRNGNITIISPTGHYDFFNTVTIPVSNTSIFGEDVSTTWWYNGNGTFIECRNPLDAGLQSIKIRNIRLRDRQGNGEIALSHFKVRQSTFDDVEIWGNNSGNGWKTAGLYIDGGQLDGSWNNRFRNLKCANMEGMAHLIRTTQNNAIFFDKCSTENCGRATGYMTWICGGNGVTFRDSHFENFQRAIRISPYDASFNLRSINLLNCYFEANETQPNNRCVYITNKDKDGNADKVINLTGLNIEGGYWSGHGCDYGIEIDVASGNVVNGSIKDVFYRNLNNAFLKSSTAGERIKITARVYDSIPLLDKTTNSNCWVEEENAGYNIIKVLNRYVNLSNPNNFYNIEKQHSFLRLTFSQTLPGNAIVTTVSAQPSSAGNIVLTLPLISDLAFENEFFIFKGSNDSNTITIMPSAGNQFNTPLPSSRNWNTLTKVNQYIRVVKDTTAGWRIVDYGVLNRDKFIYNRNNPNGVVTAKSGTIYFQLDTSDNVIDVFIKTLTDDDNTNWFSLLPKEATTTIKGLVNQGVAVPDGSSIDTLLASLRAAGLIET